MLSCFTKDLNQNSIPILLLGTNQLSPWLNQQPLNVQNWVYSNQFTANDETFCLIPDGQGGIHRVLFGLNKSNDFWSIGALPKKLPRNSYHLEYDASFFNQGQIEQAFLAWGLGSYQYKISNNNNQIEYPQLFLPHEKFNKTIEHWVQAIYWVRQLISTPAEDMGPVELSQAAYQLHLKHGAKIELTTGEDLLINNYPGIFSVGKASNRLPCLIDLKWGEENHPKVTLVGKGVCFDTGGLNLKNSAAMRLMKKDMGGAANVLGLASVIMQQQLPIRLRVLIPAVDNAVSGSSYRPGDILRTRKGLRIEVGNTDAEGRIVLADALVAAAEENPELLIDIATLTGAARVALGPEVSVYFSNNEKMATGLEKAAQKQQDPIWRLPLYQPYKRFLKSEISDCCNVPSAEYGGAITAALFLEQFIPEGIPWAHFDIMAWNDGSLPGKPLGGEAMAIRAIFSYIENWLESFMHID